MTTFIYVCTGNARFGKLVMLIRKLPFAAFVKLIAVNQTNGRLKPLYFYF